MSTLTIVAPRWDTFLRPFLYEYVTVTYTVDDTEHVVTGKVVQVLRDDLVLQKWPDLYIPIESITKVEEA